MIGIIALIFLGPRRMPEIARKMGKIKAEFRTTTQDFKSTWEREVNIDAETKAFEVDVLEEDAEASETEKAKLPSDESPGSTIASPEIKAVDKESFDRMVAEAGTNTLETDEKEVAEEVDVLSDKRTWL